MSWCCPTNVSPVRSVQRDRGIQNVASGAHGLDQLRLLRISFDAISQSADVHVDAAIGRGRVAPLRQFEQLVARHYVVGSLDKGEQDIELRGAQVNLGSCRRVELAPLHIETPGGKLEHAAGSGC